MRDRWLELGASRGRATWARQKRRLGALRVPDNVVMTLEQWAVPAARLEPLVRLVRDIVITNAVHRARQSQGKVVRGSAREPHYEPRPEDPGLLGPIRDIVERVITDLERLIHWKFTSPIALRELDARLRPTRRVVRLSRLDESLRSLFEQARDVLLPVRAQLRQATQRRRGRPVELVHPFRVSVFGSQVIRPKAARPREFERLLRDTLLSVHPDRETRPRSALVAVRRLAHDVRRSILARSPAQRV